MRRTTLADQLLEVLLEAGVQRIYGVVGDSLNPVVDAIRRTDGIEWVHVRNEEAGAFAAAAEAQRRRPHITGAQVKGFALSGGKIVLDGGVGKMIELARANVRNIPRPAIAR